MIGNDIVDLKQAAKDSPDSYREGKRHQRFLDKVFTQKEQQLILYSRDQHQMVWLLWSMKEAAYKVNVQRFEKRFFNPKRLECELISETKGMVEIDDESYFTTSEITEDYVYTIATLTTSEKYISAFFKIEKCDYKTQSETLKNEVFKFIKFKNLKIKKTKIGIPKISYKNKELSLSLSLTHHGAFSGYSIL